MKFTPEQERWLKENIEKADSYAHLVQMFNFVFGASRTVSQLRDKCTKQMGIGIGKNGGRFSRDSKPRKLPVGTIRKSQVATYIKIGDFVEDLTGYQKPNWIPLQQKIYEDAHGKLPDGMMVCFLDNDSGNFALENLRPITRQTSARMAKNGWWSTDPQITLAAILLCELQIAMKG